MPNYSKVQFIAWGLYTGPINDPNGNSYPGLTSTLTTTRDSLFLDTPGQLVDILARVEFTKEAINAAYKGADKSEDTLKIFVAPEFLYRGAAGAYMYDLLNGWGNGSDLSDKIPSTYKGPWHGLVGELRELVRKPEFKDWVFIFGSAVGAAFKPERNKTALTQGDVKADGWNFSLVQCGGDTEEQQNACYYTEKHLKSGIDFIDHNLASPQKFVFTNQNIEHTSAQDKAVLDVAMRDDPQPGDGGGALFRFPHICGMDGEMLQFGLEICLDHAQQKVPVDPNAAVTGRLASSGAKVDIQIVPSCGMMLLEKSLALASRNGTYGYSYAFNCDGLSALRPANAGGELGGHLQLWKGNDSDESEHPHQSLITVANTCTGRLNPQAAEGSEEPQILSVTDKIRLSDLQIPPNVLAAIKTNGEFIYANQLWSSHKPFRVGANPHTIFWPEGAGFVCIVGAVPLDPPPETPKNQKERPERRGEPAALSEKKERRGKEPKDADSSGEEL